MPRFGPLKRKDLIKFLRILHMHQEMGFDGPYTGGKHQFMVRGEITLRIPNPHQKDIGKELLSRILKQGKIDKDTWEKL